MDKAYLLERYLQGKLTETELEAFDALVKSDPNFKEEMEFQKDVKHAVTAEEDLAFKELLEEFEAEAKAEEQQSFRTKETKTRTYPTKWLVAASVALLIGLAYLFSVKQSADPQDLFAQNFAPYRNVTHPITRGDEAIDQKTLAFSAYAQGNYLKAVSLFTELFAAEKEPYYLFYKANALIQLNRAEEAIPLLEAHLKTEDVLTDKSHWYLAMAYLQLGDTEKAKGALHNAVETKGYKTAEARQLLDAL